TGRRVSRPNPESDWITAEAPELAIVDRGLFDRVGAIKAKKGGAHASYARRAPYALSGLIKCGICGSGYSAIGANRLGCSGRHERGECTNSRTITRTELDERVLRALRDRLAEPRRIELYVRAHAEEQRLARAAGRKQQHELERRLGTARR